MSLLVKLDEALSDSLADLVRARGYDTRTVRGQSWSGLKDPVLWPRVAAENAFFITTDKGFADIRRFPPGTHAGILLLRPVREGLLEYKQLLAGVLERSELADLRGCVSVATPTGVRVRRPSQGEETQT